MGPVLDELAKNHSDKVVVRKVHVDKDPDTTWKYGVTSLSTTIFLDSEGEERAREFGAFSVEYLLNRVREIEKERLKESQGAK